MLATQLHYFTGFTLVDVTATGVIRNGQEITRDQQRNWETILQTIGLIAQPVDLVEPLVVETNLDYLEFGEFYQGNHRVWIWSFAVEHSEVFTIDNNPTARLEQYFEQVPMVCGLEETARFMLPIFYPYGSIKNIYFKMGQTNINNI